jgi:plastocyanin
VRRRHTLLLGSTLALVAAAPAAAAEVQVQGLGTSWSISEVRIAAGDTVVWTFPNPEEVHNVQANVVPGTTSWTYSTQPQMPALPGSYKFDTPGVYGFICQVHSAMSGRVTVGDAPPPPPPPLSEQPFPNDSSLPGVLETGGLDVTKPTLGAVRVRRASHGARIRFRVSEYAIVTVRFKRGGKTVKSATFNASGSYHGTLRKGLRPGRYRVELRAEDVAGNRSGMRTAHVTVR